MAHQFFFNTYILDNLPLPEKGFDVVQDISEPRLRMYITQRGVKSFFVRKRINGCDKRVIIGNYPETDIEEARAKVSDILNMSYKKVPVRRKKISFKDFIDLYILLKHYSLAEILDFYRRKYPEFSEYRALLSMTYFEDAEMQDMPIIFIDTTWDEMKTEIIQAVKAYQK